jgi:1-acyl-sn-glycerol-3-phosphate acyltransferase
MATTVRSAARPFRDLYYTRIATTGLSFFLFGLGGVLLGAIVVPLLLIVPGGRAARQRRVRRMIRLAFRFFIGFMNRTGAISYAFEGAERLGRPGQLIIANHPSLIDIVLLLAFTPGTGCVVKRAAWRNPSMVVAVAGAGYVPNAPTDRMIERASALLESGESLIMFPEGTRTVPGRAAFFHRGAASVAVRAARCVTPVFIRVEPPHLSKAVPWYRVPAVRPHYLLRVGPDIDPGPFRSRPGPIASRALQQHLLATYALEAPPN